MADLYDLARDAVERIRQTATPADPYRYFSLEDLQQIEPQIAGATRRELIETLEQIPGIESAAVGARLWRFLTKQA